MLKKVAMLKLNVTQNLPVVEVEVWVWYLLKKDSVWCFVLTKIELEVE